LWLGHVTRKQVERVADALNNLTMALEEAKVIASSEAGAKREFLDNHGI
jgi:hypothetical protein